MNDAIFIDFKVEQGRSVTSESEMEDVNILAATKLFICGCL